MVRAGSALAIAAKVGTGFATAIAQGDAANTAGKERVAAPQLTWFRTVRDKSRIGIGCGSEQITTERNSDFRTRLDAASWIEKSPIVDHPTYHTHVGGLLSPLLTKEVSNDWSEDSSHAASCSIVQPKSDAFVAHSQTMATLQPNCNNSSC